MAKSEKLSKAQVKQLQSIGIKNAKDVEAGRKAMIAFLHSEDIEDVDEDTFDELFEMSSLMYEGSDKENDELAEEVEAEEDLEAEIEAEVEEEEMEEEEEDTKPAKKTPKPKATKPKAEKKDKVKRVTKRLDPKNNPEDAKRYDALVSAVEALSPDDAFDFNFIANGGVTVKFLGDNSKRAFFSFDSPKCKGEQILARVYFPVLKKEDDVRSLFGEDYEIKSDWSGNHLVHDVDVNDLVTLMTDDAEKFQAILTGLGKKDEKLGKNRKKMMDDLKSDKEEKVAAIKSKKAPKVEAEAEAEVEETAPAKKPKKKIIKKKSSSKAPAAKKTTSKKKTAAKK